MPATHRKPALLAALAALLAIGGGAWWWHGRPASPPPAPPSALSALARPPDWSLLDAYQHSITRAEFELLLMTAFTTSDAWREFIQVTNDGARIQTGEAPPKAT